MKQIVVWEQEDENIKDLNNNYFIKSQLLSDLYPKERLPCFEIFLILCGGLSCTW
jgi:hypothetical protein